MVVLVFSPWWQNTGKWPQAVYIRVCVYTHRVLSCLLFRFSVLKQVESTMYFVCVHWRTETGSNWERERKKGKKKNSKQKCLQWRREGITITQTHRVSGINITEEKLTWESTSFLKFFSGFFVWLADFLLRKKTHNRMFDHLMEVCASHGFFEA